MKLSKTRTLVECAILIAIATVLSMFKLVDLPYGGSVTIASMLPIILISYRHGLLWGFGSGLIYGGVQQLLGLNTLSYVTTWQSILAVILLDYIVAFAVIGFAGVFRKMKSQSSAMILGTLLVCVLRYACHVISGATVWAGLSIPTKAALLYSFAYNATYMIPETIVTVIVAFYLASLIDLRKEQPTRIVRENLSPAASLAKWGGGLALSGMLIFDVASVFAKLQDAETGEFYIQGIQDVNWVRIAVVSGVCILAALALFLYSRAAKKATK